MSLLSSIRTATAAFNEAAQARNTRETAPGGGWLRNAWSSLTGGMPTRAQADVALHTVAAQVNAKQQPALAVDILVPPDRTSLTDYEIQFALVKRVLEEAGVQPSKAAVEEVVGRITEHYYTAAGDTLHQRVSPGKPQAAFINGHKARVYHMQVEARSRTDILKLKGLAEQVTKAGTRAVHDQTPAERWNRVKQIYNEKYAAASTSHALADIFSLKNIGLLAGAEAALATPAAPFVIASGGSMLLIEEAKAHGTALEIKRLTLAPTKPSDLDIAAQKLAQLATQGKVIAGTAVLGGVASAGSRIGARMTDGIVKPPVEMPQEALTPEGVRVRMPVSDKPLSTTAEMRGKQITAADLKAVPEHEVINVLKAEFKPHDYQFGNSTFKLDWTGMKHILQRHDPKFWNGSVKTTQSFLEAKASIAETQNAITSVLKQNRETLIKEGTNERFQITGTYNGQQYILGIKYGRVAQFYSPAQK